MTLIKILIEIFTNKETCTVWKPSSTTDFSAVQAGKVIISKSTHWLIKNQINFMGTKHESPYFFYLVYFTALFFAKKNHKELVDKKTKAFMTKLQKIKNTSEFEFTFKSPDSIITFGEYSISKVYKRESYKLGRITHYGSKSPNGYEIKKGRSYVLVSKEDSENVWHLLHSIANKKYSPSSYKKFLKENSEIMSYVHKAKAESSNNLLKYL